MSARKNRNHEAALDLLAVAASGGIACHCEGGMAMNHPLLKRLLRDGLVHFVREPRTSFFGDHIRRTRVRPTPKGLRVMTESGRAPSRWEYEYTHFWWTPAPKNKGKPHWRAGVRRCAVPVETPQLLHSNIRYHSLIMKDAAENDAPLHGRH